jgi:hypothetical protein
MMLELWLLKVLSTFIFLLLSISAGYYGFVCLAAIFYTSDGWGALTSLFMGILFNAIAIGLWEVTKRFWNEDI